MSEFLTFAGDSPFIASFLCLLAFFAIDALVRQPFFIINRILRSRNIKAHGWPPAHCDADGDFRPPPPSA